METRAQLVEVSNPDDAVGVVLVLHGGAGRGGRRVSPTQLSVLRMVPIAKRIAEAGKGEVAVYRLLNSARGWNPADDADYTPLKDADWALDEIARRRGETLPTSLIGHSLGGRAALYAAARPEVVSAVALAPWVMPADHPRGLGGRKLLFLHGDRDRVASLERSATLARRLRMDTDVTFVEVPGGKHAMLAKSDDFIGPAAEFALTTIREATAERPLAAAG